MRPATTIALYDDLAAVLTFTGLPDATDAGRETYLHAWARICYAVCGMQDHAAVAGYAVEVFKYLRLGHTDLASQTIPGVLRRLEAITNIEAELAVWKAGNPEMAAMIDELLNQIEHVDTTVNELADTPLELLLERVGAIADEVERAEVYRGLAERASDERRTRLIEAAAQSARLLDDPQIRCHATLALLPLLEGPALAIAGELALAGALNDLHEIVSREWASYVERLAPHLAAATADALIQQIGAMGDKGREGAVKVACFAILAPYVSPGNREQMRYLAQLVLQDLEPDDQAHAKMYISD